MDPQVKSFFRTLKCHAPKQEAGILTWTHASLFGTPETAQIEWSLNELKLSGQIDNSRWSLHLRKDDASSSTGADWAIVSSEALAGGTPLAKLWRARDMIEIVRTMAPVPDQGWEAKPSRTRKGPRP